MKVCVACGNPNNRDAAKRCDQCGNQLPAASVPANPPRQPSTVTTRAQQPVDRTRRFQLPQELTKEQDLANDLPMQGRHLLIGGPGTGKSVVALLRAARLVRSKKNHSFLAYNRLLIHYCSALSPVRINAKTWNSWFMSTWRQQMKQSLPLAPPQDGSSWQEIDWLAVSHILSQANEVVPPTSFYLVIDEGQDMPKEFYWAISDLGYTNIFVAADFNQVLHPGKNSNRKDLIAALEKTPRKVVDVNASTEKLFDPEAIVEISHNHRNPGPVARLAAHICQSLNNPQSTCPKLRADMRDAAVPLLFGYDPVDPKRNLDSVCRRIILTADRNPRWLIGVLCATKTMLDTYKQALHGALTSVRQRLDHGDPRIEILDMGQQKEPDFSKGGIVLLTAHSCKGLEFDLVVIADIDTYWTSISNHQLFYVMVSRAIERVILLHNLTKPCPIDAILPQDPNLLTRDPLRP